MRDLSRAPADARQHPWGGNRALDHLRLWLTWRRMRQRVPRYRRLRVLELGFGAGDMLARLLREHHELSGIERSMLELPVREDVAGRVQLDYGAAEDADLSPNSFDLIYANHVVEHLDDPNRVFTTVHRALRPGGMFYAVTPNAESLGLALFGAHWWNLEDPTHVRFFSQASAARALRAAGFSAVSTRIVRSDSLTIEASSFVRALRSRTRAHGVLRSNAGLLSTLALTPASVIARLLVPRLSPSFEMWATRAA
jgi:2-polyprenyl-3-methyl-5-hydroxy-6-metoxy-1,4-benzoquinol methylase